MLKKKLMAALMLMGAVTVFTPGMAVMAADSNVIVVANSPEEAAGNDEDKEPLGEASDFTFDFETLDYSFTGVEEAEFYYIKVFPVVDGEENPQASSPRRLMQMQTTNIVEPLRMKSFLQGITGHM